MSDNLKIAELTAEIRTAIGIVALLHSGEQLGADDMRAAVTCIEQDLIAIERLAGCDGRVAGDSVAIPLLTLGEVAARDRYRRSTSVPAASANPLRIIQGGLSS
jgi:hypothetical protein